MARSMGYGVPASAAAPSGMRFTRARHSAKRSASRASISNHASMWWPKVIGCAGWRWVKPGSTVSASRSAMVRITSCSARIAPAMSSSASRSQSRTAVATWSLRDRPVCRRLPASPIRSVSTDSTFMCTSSSDVRHSKRARLDVGEDAFEPGDDGVPIRLAQHPHLGEHRRVGDRAPDVVPREPPVEAHRLGEPLHQRVRRLGKPARPELGGRVVIAHWNVSGTDARGPGNIVRTCSPSAIGQSSSHAQTCTKSMYCRLLGIDGTSVDASLPVAPKAGIRGPWPNSDAPLHPGPAARDRSRRRLSQISPARLQRGERDQRRGLRAQHPRPEAQPREPGGPGAFDLPGREAAFGADEQAYRLPGRVTARDRQATRRRGARGRTPGRRRRARARHPDPRFPATSGTRVRPDCCAACTAIARQCANRRSARAGSSFTTVRSQKMGRMVPTPSSIAFWTTRSIRSPLQIPWPSSTSSADSRWTGSCAPTSTSTAARGDPHESGPVLAPASVEHRERVTGDKPQHPRDVMPGGLRQGDPLAGGERQIDMEAWDLHRHRTVRAVPARKCHRSPAAGAER